MAKKNTKPDTVSVVLPDSMPVGTQPTAPQYDWRTSQADTATAGTVSTMPIPTAVPQPISTNAEQNSPQPTAEVPAQQPHHQDTRPPIAMSHSPLEGQQGGLYSDSGKSVCIALRLVSYLMFVMAPVAFIAEVMSIFSTTSVTVSAGMIVSTVLWAAIYATLFVVGGLLLVAVIKILQNLMALPKKK